MDRRLDCCVVRDLLPAYIEELTEEETTAQVREHLEGCGACRTLEANMRVQVPVEKAPKRALDFLKRVRRTRLLAAGVTLVLTLWCVWWLYDCEYHYANTEAGRQAAIEEFVPTEYLVWDGGKTIIETFAAAHCVLWQEVDSDLFLFYEGEPNNITGCMQLRRGLNGKYRPMNCSSNTSALNGGIFGEMVRVGERNYWLIGGYNCRDIYTAEVEYWGIGRTPAGEYVQYTAQRTYSITEPEFVWVWDWDELIQELWNLEETDGEVDRILLEKVRLLDREGNDITDRYQIQQDGLQGGGGKSVAEWEWLYVYIGIAAVLGAVMIRYFLRKDM